MMDLLRRQPAFVTYATRKSLVLLKDMGHGWLTVFAMLRSSAGFVNAEEASRGLANP